MTTSQPQRLGQYEISETLAAGISGPIYRAIDSQGKRDVVLKVIPRSLLDRSGPQAVARLQGEARAALNLKHPGIVSVYGCEEADGTVFVVMEHVQGAPLPECFRVPLPDAATLMVQLLDALDYAHDQGIVHLGLTPSKLLISPEGQLRIADFGVSRLGAGATQYMAPEQFLGQPADRRTDLFSAGIIFYEILTGANPFAGPTQTYVDRICNEKERMPSLVEPSVPPLFDPVCGKALAKQTYNRYPTARAFAERVRAAFETTQDSRVGQRVSRDTVAAIASAKPRPRIAAAVSISPGPQEIAPQQPLPAEKLQAVERQLAALMGPLAKVIVREAAAKTTDLSRLYELAAESLRSEDEKKAFLANRPAQRPADQAPVPPPVPRTAAAPPSIRPAERPIGPVAPPKVVPKVEVKVGQEVAKKAEPTPPKIAAEAVKKAPPVGPKADGAAPKPSQKASALEELLSRQPSSLAGYLKDQPALTADVVPAFASCVQALVAMRAANSKMLALVPQDFCFDPLGKASIQMSRTVLSGASSDAVRKPRYAVPELFAEQGGLDEATIAGGQAYALGFMFYEVLLGKKLFDNTFALQRTDLDWLRWHADLEAKAAPAKSLLPECPVALSDVLESMMEKRADKRLKNLDEILAKLRAVAARVDHTVVLGAPRVAPRPQVSRAAPVAASPTKSGGSGLVVLVVVLVLLAAAGVGGWIYRDALAQLLSNLTH